MRNNDFVDILYCGLLKGLPIIFALTMGGVLVGCSDEKPPEVAKVEVAASAVTEPVEKPSVEQMLTAMARPYERMTTVCYEPNHERTFYVLFRPAADGNNEGLLLGWYLVQNIDFYKSGNNTWYITDIGDGKFVKVYPDVTGLQCKEKSVTTP